jgi:hypothetical protein
MVVRLGQLQEHTYVRNSIRIVERLFEKDGEGYALKSNVTNPFPSGYRPELDMTDEVAPELASRFMQLL